MKNNLTFTEQKLYDYIVDFHSENGYMPPRSMLAAVFEKDGSVISRQLLNLAIKNKLCPIASPIGYIFPYQKK